jgi:ubiquinone/menaquinone biosynthesis C-methylase UbiE
MNDKDHYFSQPDNETWCRMGGNGPINVTQIMPLVKYTSDEQTFLDVGCGSATTLDAIKAIKRHVIYKGVDFIDSRIKWLIDRYPGYLFECQDARHLKEDDKSWDVVWSRHVVDHMPSFEEAITEQCRVAKKRVICILWYSITDSLEHIIKHVTYEKVFEDEYLNQYSRTKIQQFLGSLSGWSLKEFREDVSWQGDKKGKGDDTIIVLDRNE